MRRRTIRARATIGVFPVEYNYRRVFRTRTFRYLRGRINYANVETRRRRCSRTVGLVVVSADNARATETPTRPFRSRRVQQTRRNVVVDSCSPLRYETKYAAASERYIHCYPGRKITVRYHGRLRFHTVVSHTTNQPRLMSADGRSEQSSPNYRV